jgi:hypothetical protein
MSGVILAVFGSATHDALLTVLGPLIAIAVHAWGEYRRSRSKLETDEYLRSLQRRNFELTVALARLRAGLSGHENGEKTEKPCQD